MRITDSRESTALQGNVKKTRGQQEAEAALEYLRSRGVERFVHFTALDNVCSILERGIVPRSVLDGNGVEYCSNDRLRLDGSSHVNLSITHPNIPLFRKFREEYPNRYYVVLSIRPEVLLGFTGDGSGERYSFMSTNAAANCARRCNAEQLFVGQRPEWYRSDWTTDSQAEVLIPGTIPPQFIDAVLLPSDCGDDAGRAEVLKGLAETISVRGLNCGLLVCNVVFSNLRERMRDAPNAQKYEYYFLSWQTSEENCRLLESEIESIPSRSHFGSIAVPMDALEEERMQRASSNRKFGWFLEFHRPKAGLPRANEELATLAVIEKIINRSSVGVLSGDLEAYLYRAVFGGDGLRSNDAGLSRTYRHCVALAHQIQCALVELVKYQRIGPGTKLGIVGKGKSDRTLSIVARASLRDLSNLAQNIGNLYGCDNLFGEMELVNEESAEFLIDYGGEGAPRSYQEAKVSLYGQSDVASDCDPVQIQVAAKAHPEPILLRNLLRYIFRLDDFREGQYPALARALNREDTIVLLPTGSGKSMIFQMLALITPGTAFVVSPITSLIDDQVQNLEARGIDRIVGLTGRTKDKRGIERRLATGQYLICYVSPERFQIQTFINSVRNYARDNVVSVVAVDEAHCVSEWGHDFRTSYLGLARNCREVCSTEEIVPPLLALTGTASTSVLMDMKNDLGIRSPGSIIKPASFDRPELHYRVVASSSNNKFRALDEIMRERLPCDLGVDPQRICMHTGDEKTMSGIVFCQHANGSYGLMNSEKAIRYGHLGVWDYLNARYPGECSYYCGNKPGRKKSLSDKQWAMDKMEQAKRFKKNESSIMVATKAFGMGIDKPNVRWVVHFGMPSSLESYYQEVGRAARDKKNSYVYLILSDDYPRENDEMLDPASSDLERLGAIEDAKPVYGDDDISRCLFFHRSTFSGVDKELRIAREVFDLCQRDNYYDKRWHVQFDDRADDQEDGSKNNWERAIYRLTLLGAFRGYTVEYSSQSSGEFLIEPVNAGGRQLREVVMKNYLSYIRAYQSDSAFLEQSKRSLEMAVSGIDDDREYILHVLRHLLANFTYKIIEEGRRRAIMTMLDVARKTAGIGDVDDAEAYLREQIVGYLSAGDVEDDEVGLASILYDATDVAKLLAVIEYAVTEGEENAVLQQALRLLEDYPQHYGLYYVVCALQLRTGKIAESLRSIKSMAHFGKESYGIDERQCVGNYLRFMRSSSASGASLVAFDKTLRALSEISGDSYAELLKRIPSKKRATIEGINRLEWILTQVDKEMKWKMPNIEN